MSIAVRAVSDAERADVEAFYRRELKREVTLQADQEVLAARDGETVVAALRLCPEAGTLLLRTVVVAETRRGQGIGRSLLQETSHAIGRRACWCFGWSYLEGFYGAIGFVRVPDAEVPELLRHRTGPGEIATYRAAT
jgi:N-acetylglutamate synthase-like GNAT family acetyltransferase